MSANILDFDVDLVYLWVDGNDPEWQKRKRLAYSPTQQDESHEKERNTCACEGKDCKGRYADNDELRFSLRSVQEYAPWIHKIYIVTDRQIPTWLNTNNSKVEIIDHSAILPADALPTFNSVVIEHAIHRIPGLSEHFLYANDDMFFNRSVSKDDFFTPDGLPLLRLSRRPFRRLSLWTKEKIFGKKISNYNRTIANAAHLIQSRYGTYIGHKTHHNIDAYRRSDYARAYETFKNEIDSTLKNHFRSDNDIQRNLYTYFAMVEKCGKIRFTNCRESFRFHIDNQAHYVKLEHLNPILFCLNDSEYATDADRKKVTEFLCKRFPHASEFENS